MMQRRALLLQWLAAGALPGADAWAQPTADTVPPATAPPELARALPAAQLQGQARLRFFGLHVYDIRLWAPQRVGPEAWAEAPLALELVYARRLYGRAIAERSLDEMGRQGEIAPPQGERWLAAMTRLFPDVADGDRLTGLHRPGRGADFFHNGRPRGELADPDFARRFFGIWLAPQTSEPTLRAQLLSGGR